MNTKITLKDLILFIILISFGALWFYQANENTKVINRLTNNLDNLSKNLRFEGNENGVLDKRTGTYYSMDEESNMGVITSSSIKKLD